ncbi:hypothetical protein B7494_g6994 [Chlorociboria aeruginascens]|nr:hypothetical protein B7494_g6994 [Chlorociboria aeruginascens]
MPFTASDICKIILAVILPPLGVFLERGCGADLLINVLATPRTLYAILSILKAQDFNFFATIPYKMALSTKSTKGKKAKVSKKFIINASQPASDKIFDPSAFEKFLQDKIKVNGRVGNLGNDVEIKQVGDGKIEVTTHIEFSGRYLKYLTKKFLKKQQLRDWLRVVSTSKGVYELRFYNVMNDDADEEED